MAGAALSVSAATLEAEKSLESFGAGVRGSVRGLWQGVITEEDFVDGMYSTILRGYTQAWNEGAAGCGVSPEERTDDEQEELARFVETDIGYAPNFAAAIAQANRASGAKLAPALVRASMWTNSYNRVRARAQQMACANQKLMWVYNPRKEHCGDCRNLHGRVHRASSWQTWGIQPQMRGLECGGFQCGCRFEVTTRPASRGRPVLIGRG